jgi:hypothetical protein
MKIILPKTTKSIVRVKMKDLIKKMAEDDISQEEWEKASKQYQVYAGLIKKSPLFTPDTVLVVGANLLSLFIIGAINDGFHINKLWNFVPKARV